MLFQAFALASFAIASTVRAQTAASAYIEPDVPTGKPIAGDYTGALRPQIHYSPPKDFMVRESSLSAYIGLEDLRAIQNTPSTITQSYAIWTEY